MILHWLVNYVESGSAPVSAGPWFGYYAAGALFVVLVAQSLFLHHHHIRVYTAGFHARTLVAGSLLRKVLALPAYAPELRGAGQLTNMASADANRVLELFLYFHYLWDIPLQIIAALVRVSHTLSHVLSLTRARAPA